MLKHLITRQKIYAQHRKYLLGFLVLFVGTNAWLASGNLLTILQGLVNIGLAYAAGQYSNEKKYASLMLFSVAILVPLAESFYIGNDNLHSLFYIVIVFQVICLIEHKWQQGILICSCIVSGFLCNYLQHREYISAAEQAIFLSFFAFVTSKTINYLLEAQALLQKTFVERTLIGNQLDETKAFQRFTGRNQLCHYCCR